MSARSVRKGKVGERELAGILTAAGFPTERELGQSRDGGLDLTAIEVADLLIVFEGKRRERVSIHEWLDQVRAGVPAGAVGVLAWRRNREPWRVALDLDDFIALLKRLDQGDHS